MTPKLTSIDYSTLPSGMDRCGSHSPNNLGFAVRTALEKIDPNQDGRLQLEELPKSPTLEWALELGFVSGAHPAEKKFSRLAKAVQQFKDRFELCSCGSSSSDYGIVGFDLKWLEYRDKVTEAQDQHKATPSLPQELQPMLCEESGRSFLSRLTGQKSKSLEDMKAGIEFILFLMR